MSVESSPPDPTPILSVHNLTVYRGEYAAVQNVSFDLLPGTDTAVVGPNGAGKSTLIDAILGLIPARTGRVELWGRRIEQLGRLRQHIGYIPQNFIFDRSFPLSVDELVGLGWVNSAEQISSANPATSSHVARPGFRFPAFWQPHPEKKQAVRHALTRVDAAHLRHRSIGMLSGGELKRVLLAYCLVMPRRLLVLDEAFAGVDSQGEADFYTLLDELKREQGWTVLQISHDLDMVSRHCDHVLCLNRSLICHGQPDIALSPQNLLNAYGPNFSRYQHHH